ncbi:MAG: hypothetical protein KDA60_21700, partial [Planctomycetales bacterium]|nr:hypothetical protein [Planctomycetales bacterium]
MFLTFLACGMTGVAGLNLVVNPFAEYPLHIFEPAVKTSRAEKLQLWQQLEPPAEGLILGSSRVMKLEPDYLTDQTGYRFFNAGVNYALPEDHLAMLRYFSQRSGHAPRMVVLGLDVASFSDATTTDPRLLNTTELVSQIPEAVRWRDRWHRWGDLLSWQQTRESVRSLSIQLRHRELPKPVEFYRPDGLLVYQQREQEIAAGAYDFEGPLEFNQHEYEA